MEEFEEKQDIPRQRLCSEIQLFDLCDLVSCGYKSGRFCSNLELVSEFEKISDDDPRPPQRYIDEEFIDSDETEEDVNDAYEFLEYEEDEPE